MFCLRTVSREISRDKVIKSEAARVLIQNLKKITQHIFCVLDQKAGHISNCLDYVVCFHAIIVMKLQTFLIEV